MYRARLRDGPEVAVKLQRPGLAAAVALDATILRAMARVARTLLPLRSDVVGIVDELVGRIFDEMDYVAEAASAERFAAAYAVDGGAGAGLAGLVRAPRIVPELSTRAVLVMEWIDGARLTDVDALFASGLTPRDALDRGVRCSLHQLLGAGFMHSDPHPGNLVVARDGALVYLDFGMVVEIPETARRAMIRGLVGFVNRDAASLVDDLADLRFFARDDEPGRRRRGARRLPRRRGRRHGRFRNHGPRFDAHRIRRSRHERFFGRRVAVDDGAGDARVQASALFREGASRARRVEGTATGIDPNFKVIERAYPHVLARVVADRSPEMRDVLRRLVLEEDGASVRWNRVRRVAGAFAAASAAEDHASDEEDTKKTETKEEKETCAMTRAVTDAVRCAAETAAGAAIGARAVAFGTESERATREDDDEDSAAAAEAVRDAARYVLSPRARRFARGWFGISSTRATRGSPRSRTRRPSRRGGGV